MIFPFVTEFLEYFQWFLSNSYILEIQKHQFPEFQYICGKEMIYWETTGIFKVTETLPCS